MAGLVSRALETADTASVGTSMRPVSSDQPCHAKKTEALLRQKSPQVVWRHRPLERSSSATCIFIPWLTQAFFLVVVVAIGVCHDPQGLCQDANAHKWQRGRMDSHTGQGTWNCLTFGLEMLTSEGHNGQTVSLRTRSESIQHVTSAIDRTSDDPLVCGSFQATHSAGLSVTHGW